MKSQLLILGVTLGLTACVSPSTVTPLDVTFTQKTSKAPKSIQHVKITTTTKREIETDAGRLGHDINDVKLSCNLKANSFKAAFTTPATVRIPSYGSASEKLTITCIHDGKTITRTARATSAVQRQATLALTTSPLGLALAIAADAKKSKALGDTWHYPLIPITIILE